MTSIVDDVSAIAVRLRAIEEKREHAEDPVCNACDGGGWECYGLGFGDPHFRTCPACGNPNNHPSP